MAIHPFRPLKIQAITHTLLVYLIIALVSGHLVTASQQAAPSTASKQSADTPITIPMELLANRPIIRAKVNSRGPFAFLVAPDGQGTLIDQALATDLNLKPQKGGTAASQVEVEIDLGSMKLPDVPANIGENEQFVLEFGPAARPRGVIAASLWPKHLVTINYPRYQVVVEPGSLPEPNQRDVFSSRAEPPEVGVTIAVAGQVIPCRLDPLFPGGLLLPESYVRSIPIVGKPTDGGSIVTARGPVKVREMQPATNVTLGMFDLEKPLVQVADAGVACKVGGRVLIGFSITYDVTNGRVRLAK